MPQDQDIKREKIIHLDLSTGDPVVPPPIVAKTTALIGDEELSWLVYPIELMAAEKIHALVDRGEYNSRSKDIFDLCQFLPKSNTDYLK